MKTQKSTLTIAIDGYSSCGKSTLAKDLAKELKVIYIDTGAMYRGITLFAYQQGWVSETKIDKEKIVDALPKITLSFYKSNETNTAELVLNGVNVEKEIRSLAISNLVSDVAAIKEVREKLVAEQRKMGEKGGVVLDGRDIGSVVFPNAELKFFVTADPKIRAQRRYEEIKMTEENVTLEKVLKNLEKRDFIDSSREESPLIQTADAMVLDNSSMTRQEQLQWVLTKIDTFLKQYS